MSRTLVLSLALGLPLVFLACDSEEEMPGLDDGDDGQGGGKEDAISDNFILSAKQIPIKEKGAGEPYVVDGCYDFDGERHEDTVKIECGRKEGQTSFDACGQRFSEDFVDALNANFDVCAQVAAWDAGHPEWIHGIWVDTQGIYNRRTVTGGTTPSRSAPWSMHALGRAMDIDAVYLDYYENGSRVGSKSVRYDYSKATAAFDREDWDDPNYIFYDRLRECWGNRISPFFNWALGTVGENVAPLFGRRGQFVGSISFDDDTPAGNHRDHQHMSYPAILGLATCPLAWE